MFKRILVCILPFLLVSCLTTKHEAPLNPEKVILCIGDSLTAGYNVKPEDNYPSQLKQLLDQAGYSYEVKNLGHSGDTSSDLVGKIDELLANEPKLPSVAMLVIGGNDGLRKKSTEELEKNLETLITKLKEKNIRVVLGGVELEGLVFGFSYTGDFNKVYPRIAKAMDIYFIKNFLAGVSGHSDLNQSDLIHPNKDGYTIVSQNVFTFLEENELIFKQ